MQKIRLAILFSTLIFCFSTALAVPADTISHIRWVAAKDSLIQSLRRTADNLKAMVLQNQENDRKGLSHLNRYVLANNCDGANSSQDAYLNCLGNMTPYQSEMPEIQSKLNSINSLRKNKEEVAINPNLYLFLRGVAGVDVGLVKKFSTIATLEDNTLLDSEVNIESLEKFLSQKTEEFDISLKNSIKDAFSPDLIEQKKSFKRLESICINAIVNQVKKETGGDFNLYYQASYYQLAVLDNGSLGLDFFQVHFLQAVAKDGLSMDSKCTANSTVSGNLETLYNFFYKNETCEHDLSEVEVVSQTNALNQKLMDLINCQILNSRGVAGIAIMYATKKFAEELFEIHLKYNKTGFFKALRYISKSAEDFNLVRKNIYVPEFFQSIDLVVNSILNDQSYLDKIQGDIENYIACKEDFEKIYMDWLEGRIEKDLLFSKIPLQGEFLNLYAALNADADAKLLFYLSLDKNPNSDFIRIKVRSRTGAIDQEKNPSLARIKNTGDIFLFEYNYDYYKPQDGDIRVCEGYSLVKDGTAYYLAIPKSGEDFLVWRSENAPKNGPNVSGIEKTSITNESLKVLSDIEIGRIVFRDSDGYTDVIVHGSGNNYYVKIEGREGTTINSEGLAKIIKDNIPPNSGILRLLSCSSIGSAMILADYLDRDIIASEGTVTLYYDSGILVSIHSEGAWKKIKPDGTYYEDKDFTVDWNTTQTTKTWVRMEVDNNDLCQNRKYEKIELEGYQKYLSDKSVALIQNGEFKYCDLVDYEGIKDANVVHAIHAQLLNLTKFGMKYDAIKAVKEVNNELSISCVGIMQSEALIKYKQKPFKMVLLINIDYINNLGNLSQINESIAKDARPSGTSQEYRHGEKRIAFVYENLEDVITHEYAHLLTTPTDKLSVFLGWLHDMRETIQLNGKEEFVFLLEDRIKSRNDISEYASNLTKTIGDGREGGGNEMLAEIFTRYIKGMMVTEGWKNKFNAEVLKNNGINPSITAIKGDF